MAAAGEIALNSAGERILESDGDLYLDCCCDECTECAGATPAEIDVTFTNWAWSGCGKIEPSTSVFCSETEDIISGSYKHVSGTLNGTFRLVNIGQGSSGPDIQFCQYALTVTPSPTTFDVWLQLGCSLDPATCVTPYMYIYLSIAHDPLGPTTTYRLEATHWYTGNPSFPGDVLALQLFCDQISVAAAAGGADCTATVAGFVAEGCAFDIPDVTLTGDAEVNPV